MTVISKKEFNSRIDQVLTLQDYRVRVRVNKLMSVWVKVNAKVMFLSRTHQIKSVHILCLYIGLLNSV